MWIILKNKFLEIILTQIIYMPLSNFDRTGVLKSLPKFKMILNPSSYKMAHPIYRGEDIEKITKYHHLA
jgi:hypothetical protein